MNTQETPAARLQRFIDEERLIRNDWGDGYERACLLSAMVPAVADSTDPGRCPASVMPQWLARVTPSMDDRGTAKAWPAMVRRYAAVAARWHVLTDTQWRTVQRRSLLAVLHEFAVYKPPSELTEVRAVYDETVTWLLNGASREHGGELAFRVLLLEAQSLDPATRRLQRAVSRALCMDDGSVLYAANALNDYAVHATRLRGQVKSLTRAWDRINDGILTALEEECDLAEAA